MSQIKCVSFLQRIEGLFSALLVVTSFVIEKYSNHMK